MRKLIIALATLSFALVGTKAQSAESWIKVYVGDSDRNQISASGTCTIIITPKSGDKKILKAELITAGDSHADGKLSHGGQIITQGKNSVELLVGKPEHSHGDAKGGHGHDESEVSEHGEAESEHDHAESDAHEHGEADESGKSLSYFQVNYDSDSDGAAFSAVVIIKTGKATFNIKGFEYPFLDYGAVVALMETQLNEIQNLIDSNKLLKVHPAASKISLLAESLPNAKGVPDANRSEIEKTCKELIALFGEIDKAADAEKKDETILALKKYRAKVGLLAKHVHKDDEHDEHDSHDGHDH